MQRQRTIPNRKRHIRDTLPPCDLVARPFMMTLSGFYGHQKVIMSAFSSRQQPPTVQCRVHSERKHCNGLEVVCFHWTRQLGGWSRLNSASHSWTRRPALVSLVGVILDRQPCIVNNAKRSTLRRSPTVDPREIVLTGQCTYKRHLYLAYYGTFILPGAGNNIFSCFIIL